MKFHRLSRSRGFSLIELIAVLVVIVILAWVVIPRIGNMRAQAIRAYDEQTAIVLANAIEVTLTDGSLTTNTAPHEWGIVNYSNSPVSQMHYIASPVLNSAIAMNMTNWPGYLITITNTDGSLYYYTGHGIPENGSTNLVARGTGGSGGVAGIGGLAGGASGSGGVGGSGGSGGSSGPPGMVAPVLSGYAPDQLTWTYNGSVQPGYWIVMKQVGGASVDQNASDWWAQGFTQVSDQPDNSPPLGSAHGMTYGGGTPVFIFGIDGTTGARVTLNSNPYTPGSMAPAPTVPGALSLKDTVGYSVDLLIIGGSPAPTGNGITISAVTSGSKGSVTTDGSSVSYTGSSIGSDSFTYTVTDVDGQSTVGTVNVTVMSPYHNVAHYYVAYYLNPLGYAKYGAAWYAAGRGDHDAMLACAITPETEDGIVSALNAEKLTVAWATAHGFIIDQDLPFTVSEFVGGYYPSGSYLGSFIYQLEFLIPPEPGYGPWTYGDGPIPNADDFLTPFDPNAG